MPQLQSVLLETAHVMITPGITDEAALQGNQVAGWAVREGV